MLQPYTFIFGTATDFWNIKISSPYPKLSLGNFGFLAGQRLAPWRAFFGPDCPKPPFLGPEIVFLASQDAIEVMSVTHSLTHSLSGRSH